MRRLTLAVLTLALCALLAPSAGAKGIAKLTACGADRCKDATPATRSGHETGVLEGGPLVAPPEHQASFFTLRVIIGVPDQPADGPPIRLVYVPSLHLMRVLDQTSRWMAPTPSTEDALKRATAGLVPFDASELDISDAQPETKARVVEVVPAPRAGDPPSSGSDWPAWAGGGAAAMLVLGAAWALARRRRGRPDPHPVA